MNAVANGSTLRQMIFRSLGKTRYASFRFSQTATRQCSHRSTLPHKPLPNISSRIANQLRRESTTATGSRPLTDRDGGSDTTQLSEEELTSARKAQEPAYDITFTCRKCLERSSHRITKQAYHFGTTLITCPKCKNRHLISDHLKIFSDTSVTLEDILREKGEYLKKGRLGEDGDVEFYDEEQKPDEL